MQNSSPTQLHPTKSACRVSRLVGIHARIPLKRKVKHASFSRTENDTILLRCELAGGIVGYGEGLPRIYVTGESFDDTLQILKQTDFNSQFQTTFPDIPSAIEAARSINLNTTGLLQPEGVQGRGCFGNAARCALEVAFLDATFQHFQSPLWRLIEFLPGFEALSEIKDRVQYSTVITTSNLWKALFTAAVFRYYKFRYAKVKLSANPRRDRRLLAGLKAILRKTMDLRVDANEAWRPEELESRFSMLKRYGISAVEQPVPHGEVGVLEGASERWGIPIILDESLCSSDDADRAIRERLCDIFNLRISKCGGLIPCLELARLASAAGFGYQLGCQVGETGILTAAGRHLACSLKGIRYLEGSFDRLLVAERLTIEDLTFKRAGWGRRLDGPGLGIEIDSQALKRVTVEEFELFSSEETR